MLPTRLVLLAAFAATAALAQEARRPDAVAPRPTLPRWLAPPADWPARLRLTDAKVVAALETGLAWLRTHQSADGRWAAADFATPAEAAAIDIAELGPGRATHDIAATGLAMLAFAREGRPPAGDPDHRALQRAAAWLETQLDKSGRLGTAAVHDSIYDHAIGTLGLLAAASALETDLGSAAVTSAVAYLEHHRNPYGVWRYQPRDGDNDTSVTTWCTLACVGARELGLPVEARTFEGIAGWFQVATDAAGRTGYTKAGEGSSRRTGPYAMRFPPAANETLTAAGLLCRRLLGTPAAELESSLGLLAHKPPQWHPERGQVDYCGWFFGGEAVRLLDGGAALAWQRDLATALVTGQRQDGRLAGSWDPVDAWGEDGGRVYATALAVLALQTHYPRRS